MFNLGRHEKAVILILLAALFAGLIVSFYQNRTVSVEVRASSLSSPSDALEYTEKAKININEAASEELASLKGVGNTLANRIIEYRSKNGYFRTTEELKKVKGVGDKLFDRIKDRISTE